MSCRKPITALNLGIVPETGKMRVKIKLPHIDESLADFRKRYGNDRVMLLPCGHCLSCRLKRRKEWAVRCVLESFYHEQNCFVTLTYDDVHYFDDVKRVKADFQDFIKSLRNDGIKVRYFGCGERGSKFSRLHLHIALFGFIPDDLKFYERSASGYPMYISQYLDKVWHRGIVRVGDFASGVGNYIAGYVSKKVGQDDSFLLMSKKPGIGYQYLFDNRVDIAKFNRIVEDFGDFKFSSLPRYFSKIAEKYGLDLPYKNLGNVLADDARCSAMQVHQYDHEEFYYFDQDSHLKNRSKKLLVRSV